MKALRIKLGGEDRVVFRCPACESCHNIVPGRWRWNGDVDSPTFSPSVRVTWGNTKSASCCHFFVTNGRVKFCADSTHALAGQEVDLPDLTSDEVAFWSEGRLRPHGGGA